MDATSNKSAGQSPNVPESWGMQVLGELVDFLDGQRRPVKDVDRARMRGLIPYYGASGVVDYVNDYIFDEDLILLGEDGENILSRNCPLAFRISGKAWVNNHAHVLRPRAGISLGFLVEYLESLNYEQYNSGTAQPKLNKQACLNIPVLVPPLAEQQAIATALSDADAYIESLEQLITKKRQIKQGVMQELLTGKRRLPGFEGEWRDEPFDKILFRINAKQHQIQTNEYQRAGRFPVIDQGQSLITAFSDRADKLLCPPSGGVIIFGDHTCIIKFIDFPFLVGADGTQILAPREGQNAHFHATQLQFRGILPTGYNRHFKILRSRIFGVPALEEQNAISAVFRDMEHEIEGLETKVCKMRQIKQAMMQQLLTGKIRLV